MHTMKAYIAFKRIPVAICAYRKGLLFVFSRFLGALRHPSNVWGLNWLPPPKRSPFPAAFAGTTQVHNGSPHRDPHTGLYKRKYRTCWSGWQSVKPHSARSAEFWRQVQLLYKGIPSSQVLPTRIQDSPRAEVATAVVCSHQDNPTLWICAFLLKIQLQTQFSGLQNFITCLIS